MLYERVWVGIGSIVNAGDDMDGHSDCIITRLKWRVLGYVHAIGVGYDTGYVPVLSDLPFESLVIC